MEHGACFDYLREYCICKFKEEDGKGYHPTIYARVTNTLKPHCVKLSYYVIHVQPHNQTKEHQQCRPYLGIEYAGSIKCIMRRYEYLYNVLVWSRYVEACVQKTTKKLLWRLLLPRDGIAGILVTAACVSARYCDSFILSLVLFCLSVRQRVKKKGNQSLIA